MQNPFDNLIKDYGKSLTKLCMSLCNNFHDAQDLYQSTWEKAMKKYKHYDANKPFEKWLYAICINTYRDSLRRFDIKKVFKFNTIDEQERYINSVADFSNDKDEYISLHSSIIKLSPQLRETIVLYYFKDYTIDELSEILMIPAGTVKSRLHTARNQIKKELNVDE